MFQPAAYMENIHQGEKRTISEVSSPSSSTGSPATKTQVMEPSGKVQQGGQEPPPPWFIDYMDRYNRELHEKLDQKLEPLDHINANIAMLCNKADHA